MSTSYVSFLTQTSSQISIYLGTIILIGGVLGCFLNILVFLSLRTFRENSTAFYLTVSSFVNIGQLITGLVSRIMINAYNVDWTSMSPVYCKLRAYLIQLFTLISLTSICFATMDQFFATSNNLRWRSWCNIRIAYRLSAICILFWTIYFIPYLIFYNLVYYPSSNTWSCLITNDIFLQYTNKFYIPVIFAPLPLLITSIFAILAYRNIRQIPYRTVPLVRLESEKQLTIIVLVQVLFDIICTVPCVTMLTIANHSGYLPELQFTLAVVITLYYLYCACPFYISMCASKRFRNQFFYVLFRIHLNRWRPQRINPLN